MKYSIIKFLHRSEVSAEASNDVRVTYSYEGASIVEYDLELEKAQAILRKTAEEVKFLQGIIDEFDAIRLAGGKKKDENIRKWLEESQNKYKDHELLKHIYSWREYVIHRDIRDIISYRSGEYLIVPSIYMSI